MKPLRVQTILIATAFVGVAGFALADQGNKLSSRANQSYRDTAPIIRDGDTLIVKRQPVRIFGIDAPDDADESMSKAAAKYLEAMIITQGGVTCSGARIDTLTEGKACVKSANSYDRINMLCRFNSSQASVGATMVAHGYAVDYRLFSAGVYKSAMLSAASQRRGLWRDRYPDMAALANSRAKLPSRCKQAF